MDNTMPTTDFTGIFGQIRPAIQYMSESTDKTKLYSLCFYL